MLHILALFYDITWFAVWFFIVLLSVLLWDIWSVLSLDVLRSLCTGRRRLKVWTSFGVCLHTTQLCWLGSSTKQVWLWLKRLNFSSRIFHWQCIQMYVLHSREMHWSEMLCSPMISCSSAEQLMHWIPTAYLLKDCKDLQRNVFECMCFNSHSLWIELEMYFSFAFEVTWKGKREAFLIFTFIL